MPNSYLAVMGELQQRSLAALKATHDAHLASLSLAREVATRTQPIDPAFSGVTQLNLAIGFRVLAEQAEYVQHFVEAFTHQRPIKASATPEIHSSRLNSEHVAHAALEPIAERSPSPILVPPFGEPGPPDERVVDGALPTGSVLLQKPEPVPFLETVSGVIADSSAKIIAAETAVPADFPAVSIHRMPPKRKSGVPRPSR